MVNVCTGVQLECNSDRLQVGKGKVYVDIVEL